MLLPMTTLTACRNASEYATIIDDKLPLVYVIKAKLMEIIENEITNDNFDSMSYCK